MRTLTRLVFVSLLIAKQLRYLQGIGSERPGVWRTKDHLPHPSDGSQWKWLCGHARTVLLELNVFVCVFF